MSFFEIFWLAFLAFSLGPLVKQRIIETQRYHLMREIQKKRKSRLITLIHRQEAISFLGIPIFRYIDIEDSEEVLRVIRMTPPDVTIDLVLHTPGGLALAAEQIALALSKHPAQVTVFIPHYAMSGGTLVALAADEIVMDENAVLGPLDPQLGEFPAVSVLRAVRRKKLENIDDKTLILADVAEKAVSQVQELVAKVLSRRLSKAKALKLARILTSGNWTHDYPITCEQARKLNLPVTNKMPPEIYSLMRLYPQSPQRRPSVQYVPIAESKEEGS